MRAARRWRWTRTMVAGAFLAVPLAAAVLVFGTARPANADLAAVGPVDPGTGFPLWFEDAVGLRLQLCDEFDPGGVVDEQPPCLPELLNPALGVVAGNIGEALYYAAAAEFDGPNGEAILAQCALEAAGPEGGVGDNTVGNGARLRIGNLLVEGNYSVVTPCTVEPFTFNVPADVEVGGRFDGVQEGAIGVPTIFDGALPGAIQIFASNGTVLPGFLGDALGVGLLSNPLRPGGPTAVTVSLNGTVIATGEDFSVVGKVSGCTADNEAPTANADQAATLAATPVTVAVLANDSDVVVDPVLGPIVVTPAAGRVAIVADSIAPAGSGTAVANADGTVTFTPAAGFSGVATFAYTVTDFCGLVSNAAAVTVLVEDIQVNTAELRTKVLKWLVAGTSSDTRLRAALDGAQEVEPVVTAATGAATFLLNPEGTQIAFTLDVAGLSGAVTASHIHLGAPGVNGGVLFPLALADFTGGTGSGTLTGTLTAADFTAQGDVVTFAQALEALFSGRTYVNVHTAANPPGEIRGQIVPNAFSVHAGSDLAQPLVGIAPVGPDGRWSLDGGALTAPARPAAVSVESSNGISVLNQALDVR